MDRRKKWQCKAFVAVFLYLIFWTVTIAYASDISYSGLNITQVQFWIIGGLLGVVQTLIAYIYVSGIRELKSAIRKLFEEVENLRDRKIDKEMIKDLSTKLERLQIEKLDKDVHEDLCRRLNDKGW